MPLGLDSDWSELLTICECIEDLRWLCDYLTGGTSEVSRVRNDIIDRIGRNSRIGARFML